MATGARELHPPSARSAILWISATLAVAVHAWALLCLRFAAQMPPLIQVEGGHLEVALVKSAPAAPAPEATPEPPEPEPSPLPEPGVVAPPLPPKMALPHTRGETPAPPPRSTAKPAPKSIAKPARTNPTSTPSAAPSGGGIAVAGIRTGGAGGEKPADRPVFVVRPAPVYPAESRAAGEQGVVILRITVNGGGRPSAVSVARSSGFPRLDRAAIEGGWRSRVKNAAAGAQVDAPVRFNLRD